LLPLVALIASAALTSLPRTAFAIVGLIVLIYQGVGVANVVAHSNTIKGSYNTDYLSAMGQIRKWKDDCIGTVVFNHDVVLSYLLDSEGIRQSTPFIGSESGIKVTQGMCVLVAKSFRGIFSREVIDGFYGITGRDELQLAETANLSPDPYAAIKGRISHDEFPSHLLKLELYRVTRDATLDGWVDEGRGLAIDP
jgi:hypothetical protein